MIMNILYRRYNFFDVYRVCVYGLLLVILLSFTPNCHVDGFTNIYQKSQNLVILNKINKLIRVSRMKPMYVINGSASMDVKKSRILLLEELKKNNLRQTEMNDTCKTIYSNLSTTKTATIPSIRSDVEVDKLLFEKNEAVSRIKLLESKIAVMEVAFLRERSFKINAEAELNKKNTLLYDSVINQTSLKAEIQRLQAKNDVLVSSLKYQRSLKETEPIPIPISIQSNDSSQQSEMEMKLLTELATIKSIVEMLQYNLQSIKVNPGSEDSISNLVPDDLLISPSITNMPNISTSDTLFPKEAIFISEEIDLNVSNISHDQESIPISTSIIPRPILIATEVKVIQNNHTYNDDDDDDDNDDNHIRSQIAQKISRKVNDSFQFVRQMISRIDQISNKPRTRVQETAGGLFFGLKSLINKSKSFRPSFTNLTTTADRFL